MSGQQDSYEYHQNPYEKKPNVLFADIQSIDKRDNDSLDNNQDGRSQKDDQDLLGFLNVDYDKNQQNKLGEINLLNDDDQKKQYNIMNDAQNILNDKIDENKYEVILKQIYKNLEYINSQKYIKLIGLIMNANSSLEKQLQYVVRVFIFLKQIWNRLGKIQNIIKYYNLLNEILKSNHKFYSLKLNKQTIEILEFYLCQQYQQINIQIQNQDNIFNNLSSLKFHKEIIQSIQSLIGQFYANQNQILENHINPLYDFIYRKFIENCFRKNIQHLYTNILLLSKGFNIDIRYYYLNQYQEGVYIHDFTILDKKQLQDYAINISEIVIDNSDLAQKYIFRLIQWLLADNSQMEKKILGFKILGELAILTRSRHAFSNILIEWLLKNQIIEKFLRDSTHMRILQYISPVLHFLYENERIESSYLIELMKLSLHSQDLFKIVQNMLSWLRIQHLQEAYDMLNHQKQKEKQSSLISQFINALVSSPVLQGNNSRKRKNIMIQDNRRSQFDGEMDIQVNQLSQKASFLVKRLFKFLIEKVLADQQLFMPILLRHITAHMKLLKSQIEKQIVSLLRHNSSSAIWILEHCLKIQTSHDPGQGQGKYELIGRLASQGVYQHTLAILARNRYSKPIVDKCLSVVILFCRFHKPLQRNITEYLWKVLGLTASDEKQREQFFVFLKDIVRFEGSITEESVNFIFFQLLMALCADWFSLRVYDCLEMLFLRLNEDCKLITFEKDHYKINESSLIGIDKFWYIYFNSPDLKVIKKCKDFIFKLIVNALDKKQQLYQQALINIKKYLQASLQLGEQYQNKRQILILRGFQISQKLLLQRERLQQGIRDTSINLKIFDTTPDCFEKTKNIQVNQKLTLSDLRLYIADNLNPIRKQWQIELLNKGKKLVGQNQTLKQLKLENNETITVSLVNIDIEPLSKTQKDQIKIDHQEQLYSLFGEQFTKQFIEYIVNKLEGENLENIANIMFDPLRIEEIKEEYQRSKQQAEEDFVIQKIQKPIKFGEMLVQTIANTQLLLKCLEKSHNKKGGWKFLKELPINKDYFKIVEDHIQTGDWKSLFNKKYHEESKYIAYILNQIIKQSQQQSQTIFNSKNLRNFLIQRIMNLLESDQSLDKLQEYQNIFKLLLSSLKCPIFTQLQNFNRNKKSQNEQKNLSQKISSLMQVQVLDFININPKICIDLINALQKHYISQKMTLQIAKLYLYQLYFSPRQSQSYLILDHPKLILKYGKPIYFLIIFSVKRWQQNVDIKDFNLSAFTQRLLSQSLQKSTQYQKQQKKYYSSYFDCIQQLFSMIRHSDAQTQRNRLFQTMIYIRTNIDSLLQQQIIGYMKIIYKLFQRNNQFQKQTISQIKHFALWIFNQYLFGIKDSLPYFKNKGVRKISYRLINLLCKQYSSINIHITNSIKDIMNKYKGIQRQQGQFRTSDFVGMKNLGATCYINSLLQQLYHTVFPKLLLQQDNDQNNNQVKLLDLKKIFVNLYIGAKSPVATTKYVQTVNINGEQIRPLVQQDVNQYFASLMHDIQQSVGNKAINSIMTGTFCHEIRGLEEGSQVKNVEQTYLTLMIEMKGKKNLSEALSTLSKQHILEGENMYYSQVLRKKIRASSKTYLDKLPPLLVITLKRFYWNFQTMTRHKINDYFQFPLELQLSRYSLPGKKQADHYFQYKLVGILIHSGSAQSGHYYSFIKVGQKWLQFNDKRVSEWDIQNNLKNECFGGNQQRNRNAYMLFYERIQSHTHGASLHLLPDSNQLIQQVKSQNQNFIRNRLIYDSGYIDFIKQLSKISQNTSFLNSILDDLNINKNSLKSNDPIQIDNVDAVVAIKSTSNQKQLVKKLDEYAELCQLSKSSSKEGDYIDGLMNLNPTQIGKQNELL